MAEPYPDPLVPAEVDLRGLEWMPLYGNRLFGSTFDVHADDATFRAGMQIWWAAWNQVPASSLPNDDVALCRLSGLGKDMRTWKKIRTKVLHGFVLCNDGRLYNRAMSVWALESWHRRQDQREANAAKSERQRRWRERLKVLSAALRDAGKKPPRGASLETLEEMARDAGVVVPALTHEASPETSVETSTEPDGRGGVDDYRGVTLASEEIGKTGKDRTGEESKDSSEANASGAKAPRVDPASELWRTGVDWLRSVTGKPDGKCRSLIGKWRKDLGDAELLELLGKARAENIQAPEAWFAAVIRERQKNPRADDPPPRTAAEVIAQREADPRWAGVQ